MSLTPSNMSSPSFKPAGVGGSQGASSTGSSGPRSTQRPSGDKSFSKIMEKGKSKSTDGGKSSETKRKGNEDDDVELFTTTEEGDSGAGEVLEQNTPEETTEFSAEDANKVQKQPGEKISKQGPQAPVKGEKKLGELSGEKITKKAPETSLSKEMTGAKPVKPGSTNPAAPILAKKEVNESEESVPSEDELATARGVKDEGPKRAAIEGRDDNKMKIKGDGEKIGGVLGSKKEDKTKGTRESEEARSTTGYVTPMNVQGVSNTSMRADSTVVRTTDIQEIINALVTKVEQVATDTGTETKITLGNPSGFQGAELTVKTAADGGLSISFQNLTENAKRMIDLNQGTLKRALEEKGYAVETLITTTKAQVSVAAESQQSGSDKERQRGDEGGQNQGGRQQQQQRRGGQPSDNA